MMKFCTAGGFAAGLVLAATAVQAQGSAPSEPGRPAYRSVSDIGDPYALPPPQYPGPRYSPGYGPGYGPAYGQGPMLLPPTEVYTVVRESGFSPLGAPQQRGYVYTIAVIDRGGGHGRLIIDARIGRVIRFIPAYRIGERFNDDLTMHYGPPGPPPYARGAPRPPQAVPPVASRSVPVPRPSPLAAAKPVAAEPVAKPVASQPATKPAGPPVQQSAEVQKPAGAPTPPAAAVTTGAVQAKPAAPIAPTQDMPKVQALE